VVVNVGAVEALVLLLLLELVSEGVDVDPADDDTRSLFLYKLSLLPAPQYSHGFPAHFIRHSVTGASTAPAARVFPHQHSLLWSADTRKIPALPGHVPAVFNPRPSVCIADPKALRNRHVIRAGEQG
jgi:hypothetical protein